MKTKREYSSKWFKKFRTKVAFSKLFKWIGDIKSVPFVVYARVSSHEQKTNMNLDIQKERVIRELEKRFQIKIKEEHVFVESVESWKDIGVPSLDGPLVGRGELWSAILMAKRIGGVVVAESADRFIRGWVKDKADYKKQRQLCEIEVESLAMLQEAEGVSLVTLIKPNASFEEVRSEQTKRGQAGKNSFGGRPRKKKETLKERKAKLQPTVIQMRSKGGSYGAIKTATGLPVSTIRDWLV